MMYSGLSIFREETKSTWNSWRFLMAGDLLKELPSFNKQNFSKFKADSAVRCSHQRPVVYLPTKDTSEQAVIVTDKCNILLRYLHQQLENKHEQRKREPSLADLSTPGDYKPSAKVPRRMGPAESSTEQGQKNTRT